MSGVVSAGAKTSAAKFNATTASSTGFLKGPVAHGITGACVFLAVLITVSQVRERVTSLQIGRYRYSAFIAPYNVDLV